MKHRVVHALQKYLLNPPIKLLFAMGLAPPGYALLETTRCKTGKSRRTISGSWQSRHERGIRPQSGTSTPASFAPPPSASDNADQWLGPCCWTVQTVAPHVAPPRSHRPTPPQRLLNGALLGNC